MIGCFNLYESPYMQEFSDEPVKSIPFKRWMRGRVYHKRLNKKLLKRFGTEKKRQFIQSGDAIFAHPNNIAILRSSVQISN